MVNKNFIAFLDQLKTPRNEALVESVKEGYILCEMGPIQRNNNGVNMNFDAPEEVDEFVEQVPVDDSEFDKNGDLLGVDELMARHHGDYNGDSGDDDFNAVDNANAFECGGECTGPDCGIEEGAADDITTDDFKG